MRTVWRRSRVRSRILAVLADGEWRFGWDIMRAVPTRSDLFYGAVYDLEAQLLVQSRWVDDGADGPRRRQYRCTLLTVPDPGVPEAPAS